LLSALRLTLQLAVVVARRAARAAKAQEECYTCWFAINKQFNQSFTAHVASICTLPLARSAARLVVTLK